MSFPGVYQEPLFGLSPPDDRNFLRLQSDGRREGQYARLISPPVHLPQSPVCMEFQYQATGGRGVALQVVREASQESKLLWVIREDQGSEWKHGRIILPSYDMEYQVGRWREPVRGSAGVLVICISIFQRAVCAHSSLGNVVKPLFSLCFSTLPWQLNDTLICYSECAYLYTQTWFFVPPIAFYIAEIFSSQCFFSPF